MRQLPDIELNPEQEEEAARIEEALLAKSRVATRHLARVLASKENRDMLGATEFTLRDVVLRLGAEAIDIALQERKKRGTAGAAGSVRRVAKTPNSKITPPAST